MIARIKHKYAQQKAFISAKRNKETDTIRLRVKAILQNEDLSPEQKGSMSGRYMMQMRALQTAYDQAINNLDRSRDAEIGGVYGAKDRLR
jgi:hypothetical protein